MASMSRSLPAVVRLPRWSVSRVLAAIIVGAATCAAAAAQSMPAMPAPSGPITVEAVPVPLDPQDPSKTAIGDFSFAGGLALTSQQTDRLHGLSDVFITGTDRLVAVGDIGVLFDARLVLDASERLAGITDAHLVLLTGEDGRPLPGKAEADAEGLAELQSGDRLVSFEGHHRIWLYPASGGVLRQVPSPQVEFPPNYGMEALAADPAAGPDAYVVGSEVTGETWTCRLSATPCVKGPTIEMPFGYGLVAIRRLTGGKTACLLRAWDPLRGNRITLRIFQPSGVVAEMDMARPMTIDNFEGLAAVQRADGSIRFYLLSDDNASASQRTLLLAFDWRPR
jgi:hypothetical protein